MGTVTGNVFDLNSFMNLLIAAMVVAILIVGGTAVYFIKIKKVMAKEEKIDHSHFERRNAKDYVNFDNIIACRTGVSGDEFGVVVMPGYVFLAGLDIRGYNFSSASADERHRTMVNSVALFNTIEKPVQFRQTVKAIDISYNVNKQKEVCKKMELRILDIREEYKETCQLADQYVDNPVLYASVEQKLRALQREMKSLEWQQRECYAVLDYLDSLEKSTGKSAKINQMIFSYVYNPSDFSTELTEEEIYLKASAELANMAGIYGSALDNCGCRTRLLTGKEMLDLMRRHCHPATSDDVRIEDMFNSSYMGLFISSDSLISLERERIGESRFKKQMEIYRKNNEKRIKEAEDHNKEYKEQLLAAMTDFVKQTDQIEEEISPPVMTTGKRKGASVR
ncbi:MAG: hypothetical protein MR998_04350 [Lachnospiraceae bacterium]|nr:hypothetical protein [Lachnospiraceae bacterium]